MMPDVFFSVEAEFGAAPIISDILYGIRERMTLKPMKNYSDVIDEIAIIPMCVKKETRQYFKTPERKYVSWKRRTADIRLYMDWELFMTSNQEARYEQCKKLIIDSIAVVEERCIKKGYAFNKELLLSDIFPSGG